MPASALLNNTRVASASARGRFSTHCRNLRGSEGKPGGNATGSALGNAMNAAWIRLMRQLSREYALLAGRSEEHTSELKTLLSNSCAVFCLRKKHETEQTKRA